MTHDDLLAPAPTLGVCYYPEHWPESTWAEDAARMKTLGLTWVRIGEFAWMEIEPDPGRYVWAWLDRAIDVLGAYRASQWRTRKAQERKAVGLGAGIV